MRGAARGNLFMLGAFVYQIAAMILLIEISRLLGPFSDEHMITFAAVTQVVVFLPPVAFYAILNRRRLKELLPFKKVNFANLFFILLVVIVSQPVAMALSGFATIFFDNAVSEMINIFNNISYPMTVLVVCVFPAVFEELPLRGIVQSEYRRSPMWIAAIVNGLFFGFIHLNLQQFPYAFFLGIVMFYLVYVTGSIISAIFAHFLFNFTQVTLAFFILNSEIVEQATTPVPDPSELILVWVAMFAIFLPILIIILWAQTAYNKSIGNFPAVLAKEANIPEPGRLKRTVIISFLAIVFVYAWFMLAVLNSPS